MNEERFSPVLYTKMINARSQCESKITDLDETDGSSLLTEALTAEIKAVFTNETSLVGAKAAVDRRSFSKESALASVTEGAAGTHH